MRNSKLVNFQTSISNICAIGVLLFAVLVPNFSYGQCPNDTTIYVGEDCNVVAAWNEPVYSMDCEDFDESFDATDNSIWTTNANGQNGSVNTAGAPSNVSLTGSTDGTGGTNTDTDFCVTMPYDGSMSFDWSAVANSGGAQLINDEPAYTINGVETILNVDGVPVGSGISMEDGTVANLALTAGDVFCFRVKSNNMGATTTLEISNFSVEINDINQTSGIANGSTQNIGEYEIEYTYLNCDATTSMCEFTVTVADSTKPVIDCPVDQIIDLAPQECEVIASYSIPTFSDNCPNAVIRQIDGLPTGSVFPIGENPISFEAEDAVGNVDTCTFYIIVNEFSPNGLPCIDDINFSLDEETCTGELTAEMLIDVTSIGCLDSCTVFVTDTDGIKKPAIFTSEDVGERFEYEICCGGVCCWGYVDVEYKFQPILECQDTIRVSCAAAVDPALGMPTGDSNCADVEVTKLNDEFDFFSCDPMYVGKLTRSWIAEDEYGNLSNPCSTVILLRRTNTSTIIGPTSRWVAGGNAISCDNNLDLNEDGYPTPQSIESVPRLELEGGGFADLYPFEAGVICNGYVTYSDKKLGGSTECVTKIMRTWTVGEWHCTNPEPRTYVQIIEIVDFTGPEFVPVADRTVSTSSFECEAMVTMPIPMMTDACNDENIRLDLGTPNGAYPNYAGESIMLPVGTHDVIYNVYDDCGNITIDTTHVTVVDNADPIAVCDFHTVVSIGLDGLTYVSAESIDDGSFDECGDVTISIARMDDPGFEDQTGFKDKAEVHCTDIGTVLMVGLLVSDKGGNTNMCMVQIDVQDKVEAQMIVPGPVTVDCNFPFDPNNLGAFFGGVQIFDNCDTVNTRTEEVIVGELNGCGSGTLTREITLIENEQEVGFGTQTITFMPGTTLQLADIEWPEDEISFEGCPDNVNTDMTGVPVVTPRDCQNIDMRMQDEVFPFNSNGTCRKIIRTWNVIDWCIPLNDLGGALNPYSFKQTIKVNNSIAPTFVTVPEDSVYCSYATDCGAIDLSNLIATATDECTDAADLYMAFEVTDSQGTVVNNGAGLNANGTYDIGTYTLKYTIEDRCGNVNATSIDFEVRNCKQPTPYCIDGLSTSLVPMDLDEDGTPEIELVMLTPDFFDGGSFHPCGYDVTLSFSSDVTDTQKIFGCNDLGNNIVQLWATDINGNQAYCETNLLIEDNNGVNITCLPVDNSERVDVQGNIYTSTQQMIEGVTVDLEGSDLPWEYTSEAGEYLFDHMPVGGNYHVMPQKNDDLTNGVNTLDLLFIQRHLLGAQPITDTYKLIAADINNDGTIKPSDLLDLRKVILGINTSFTNNTSWRFVDEAYEFIDATDPLDEDFQESYQIDNLSEDMNIDFVGLKVGDVNGDVTLGATGNKTSTSRGSSQFGFNIENQDLEYGVQTIDIYSDSDDLINGLQAAFDLNNAQFVGVESGKLNIDPQSFTFVNGELRLSHICNNVIDVYQDEVLFSIIVNVEKPSNVADIVSVSDQFMTSEVYVGNSFETKNIDLNIISDETNEQVFNVNQNTPNPWSRTTVIDIETPKAGVVHMTVMDGQGQLVYKLNQYFEQGNHSITLTDEQISHSGIFIYRVEFDSEVVTGRMIRIR